MASSGIDPPADIHGSVEYRRQLTRHYVRLALDQAYTRALDAIKHGKGLA